jgi:hypothetical protein
VATGGNSTLASGTQTISTLTSNGGGGATGSGGGVGSTTPSSGDDKDRKAINAIEWDGKTEYAIISEGVVSFVQYDGPFFPGGLFDGAIVIDPNAPPPEGPADASAEPVHVIA